MRDRVIPAELSVTGAAKALGVARPTLSKFLNGRARLSPAMALRLESVFGANRQQLLDMQTKFDSKSTLEPVVSRYAPSVIAIRASHIERWADQIATRNELAALLRTLVHSTG